MRKKFTLSFVFILVLVFGTIVGTTASYSEKITAWFYDIKINLDSKPMGFYSRPFMYNGQVYVSINDISNNMGFGIQWDDQNKIMNLSSNSNNRFSINTLQHELDQKNLEIANLKFQLSQKKVELDILRNNKVSTSSSTTLNNLEDKLEDKFDDHRNEGRTLRFDDYRLTQLSNDHIEVKMYADFDRTSSYWRNRDDSDFEDFIEDICEEINRYYNEDMEVIVYDKDRDELAEYTYDESRERLDEESTYSSSSSDDDDIDDLEDLLERDYDDHRNNGRTMEFKEFDLEEYSSTIHINIDADFDISDRVWKDRDRSDFREFIEDVCKEVDKEFNKDIKVYVKDEDNDTLARYTYDDSDNELESSYSEY